MADVMINTTQSVNNERETETETDKDMKNFDIIYNLIYKYVNKYKPLYLETFNNGYPIENTYILEIPFIIIPKIVKFLKFKKFRKESYISNDEQQIHGLSYKSYAFYKEKKMYNTKNQIYFVFCLENDKNCRGLLLSPNF